MDEALSFTFRLLLFAAVHSLLAIPIVKRILMGQSRLRRRHYRLTYNLLAVAMFGWVMSSYSDTAVLYVVPGAWSLVMYLLQGVLLLILFKCVQDTGAAEFLGLYQSDAIRDRSSKLVTNGCYGIVRHPLYLFSMLFILLNPIITTRWLIFSLFSAFYFVIGALLEERRLTREFGEDYKNYKQTVPFIIPNLSIFRPHPANRG